MKKLWFVFKKYNQICYMSCLCTGILLLISAFFKPEWPHIIYFPVVLFIQLLLSWSGKKGFRVRFVCALILLNFAFVIYFFRTTHSLDSFYPILELEMLCLFTAAICYIARNSLLMKGILLFIQLAVLVYFSLTRFSISKWNVWLILFCLLFFIAESIEQKTASKKEQNIFYLFPFLLAATSILLILPVKETPIRWESVKNAVHLAKEKFDSLLVNIDYLMSGSSGLFSFQTAGFASDNILGGNLNRSDKELIYLIGTKTYSPVYLTGNIYDSYDGKRWEKNALKKPYGEKEFLMQEKELSSALAQSIYNDSEIYSFFHPYSFHVTYKGLKTKNLFYPPYTDRLSISEQIKVDSSFDNVLLAKPRGVGFTYDFHSMEINFDDERVRSLLRQQAWKPSFKADSERQRRADYARKFYTSLPSTLPKRVRELASEITKSLDNDYDKLKAIEAYLRQYAYSSMPPECPASQDFTDYFLFEGKSGYCTYFATAMCILARCEGIPTRYTEGFVIKSANLFDKGEVSLSGSSAHAWPEAYIENIGWVPFEPTPGYSEKSNTAWPVPKEGSLIAATVDYSNIAIPNEPQALLTDAEALHGKSQNSRFLIIFAEAVLIIALFIILLIIFYIIRNLFRRNNYSGQTANGKIALLMRRTFLLGKLYGCEKTEYETLASYEERLNGILDTSVLSYSEFCTQFLSVRFGRHTINTHNLQTAEGYVKSVEMKYFSNCGIWKKILYHMK